MGKTSHYGNLKICMQILIINLKLREVNPVDENSAIAEIYIIPQWIIEDS